MNPDVIDFRQERNFGDILNLTFSFIRQNLPLLARGLLYFVAPFMVVGMVFNTLVQVDMLGKGLFTVETDPDALLSMLGNYLGILVFGMMALGMALGVVYGLMEAYREAGPGALTVEDLWDRARGLFFRMLGTVLFLIAALGAVYLLLVMFTSVIVAAVMGSGGGLAGGILFFLILLGILALMAYLSVVFSILLPMRVAEPVGLVEGASRCFRLVRGHWWATFGVVFVAWLISSVLGGVFSLPALIVMFLQGFHGGGEPGLGVRMLLAAGGVLSGIAGALLYSIPLVATGLQYYNLVERAERVGLAERVRRMEADERGEETSDA